MPESPYRTERTKLWRSRDIKPWFVEAIDVIEKSGCQILSVSSNVVTPNFTYTTGIYDNCNQPEIITIGLPHNVAGSALNEAARRMRKGIDLSKGRHSDLLGKVDVEFHPVHPRWLHHIMLRTDWFYEGGDVPVLQLVYPDLKNRFPGELGFDVAFEQPILSGTSEHGSLEHDLWAAYDASSSLSRWKFEDSPHTSSYLSQTVNDGEESVTYVSHDADSDWQFLGDRMNEGGGPVLSCLHHPIDKDRTLEELHDLPVGWYATRENPDAPWERFEHPPEYGDEISTEKSTLPT
jgi:hypothetical protein